MKIDKKQFKKMFPHLAEEIEVEKHGMTITSTRSDIQTEEKASSSKFAGYIPDVIDFIRRCDNEKQAGEIISYMEKRGEISSRYAKILRKQLGQKGVRSFGQKKEEGYYLKQDPV